MSPLINDPIDVTSWPELDEVDVVAVLPSYARARALVWGTVTLGLGLAFSGPLVAIAIWGDKTPSVWLWVIFGGLWVTSMGLWALKNGMGGPCVAIWCGNVTSCTEVVGGREP